MGSRMSISVRSSKRKTLATSSRRNYDSRKNGYVRESTANRSLHIVRQTLVARDLITRVGASQNRNAVASGPYEISNLACCGDPTLPRFGSDLHLKREPNLQLNSSVSSCGTAAWPKSKTSGSRR